MKQYVYVGNDTYINGDKIISIINSSRPMAKKLKKKAKEKYNLLDFTCGIVLKNIFKNIIVEKSFLVNVFLVCGIKKEK